MLMLVLQIYTQVQSNTAKAESTQDPAEAATPTLKVGESLKLKILGGGSQSFTFQLNLGEFASLTVEQTSGLLLATLIDPQGEKVAMDSPAGGFGPIYLATIAKSTGNYRLKVQSVNAWAKLSDFEVILTAVRTPLETDRSFIQALERFAKGRESFRAKEPKDAITSYTESLPYWQTTQNHHWEAACQYALAEANSVLGNKKQAEDSLNETLRILNVEMAPNDWRLKASALNDLGPIYAGTQRRDRALEVLNQALALYAAHNDLRGQASALNNLATTNLRAGNFSLARQLLEQALTFRKTENDKPGASNLINNLGAISDRLGEPVEALNYFQQALKEWELAGEHRASDRSAVATVLSNIGTESDKLGKWDQALDFYERALAKYEATDSRSAGTLDSLGELYAALGNPAKAAECYDRALRVLESSGKPDVDLKAGVLVHIGQLSIAASEFNQAIRTFEQVLQLEPSKAKQADTLTNLATALAMNGDTEKAMQVYGRTLKLQTDANDLRGQALTLQKRGEAYAALKRSDEALNDFNTALPLWRIVKDQRGEASTLNGIARVEQTRGKLSAALASNAEAIGIVESLRTSISSYQLRTSYFSNQENYYALDVDLKMQISKTEKRTDYIAAALESNEKGRARVLLDSLTEADVGRTVGTDADPRFSSLIEQKLKLLSTLATKAQVRTRFLNGPHAAEQIAMLDRELNKLTSDYDDLETKIRNQNPKFANLIKATPAKFTEIQEQLDRDSLLVEFFLGQPRSYVWVVGKDSIDAAELPPRDEIEALAARVAQALSARGRTEINETIAHKQERVRIAESGYNEAAALLSKAVLKPIAHLLTKNRLVVVADGALQMLPLAVLPNPNQLDTKNPGVTQLLIESHEIVTQPSASVLVLQRRDLAHRKPASKVLAVIADPVFGESDPRIESIKSRRKNALAKNDGPQVVASSGLNHADKAAMMSRALGDIGMESESEIGRLVFSFREAKEILQTVPANQSFSALDFQASRATVMSPRLAQYRIIHLATHGVLNLNHPELSGLLLSMVDENGKEQNGYLGLNEIYNLNWPADLVVLSACETAIGKEIRGEGLIALTRGFMHAGAARVVASLWKVNDRATAELMGAFYREMIVNKSRPAAALRAAQLRLSHDPRWQNPHFWAGFVLQGEWR